jgi:hypothetical protein
MGRLTKDEKENIAYRAVADVTKAKEQKLQERLYSVSLKIYNSLFTKEQKDLMAKLPDGWLQYETSIRVNKLQYRRCEYLKFKNAVRSTYAMSCGLNANDLDSSLVEELIKVYEDKDSFDKEKRVLRGKLDNLLSTITTEKKLTEVWPEGTKYLTPCDSTENLPSITSKEVVYLMAKMKGDA